MTDDARVPGHIIDRPTDQSHATFRWTVSFNGTACAGVRERVQAGPGRLGELRVAVSVRRPRGRRAQLPRARPGTPRRTRRRTGTRGRSARSPGVVRLAAAAFEHQRRDARVFVDVESCRRDVRVVHERERHRGRHVSVSRVSIPGEGAGRSRSRRSTSRARADTTYSWRARRRMPRRRRRRCGTAGTTTCACRRRPSRPRSRAGTTRKSEDHPEHHVRARDGDDADPEGFPPSGVVGFRVRLANVTALTHGTNASSDAPPLFDYRPYPTA